MRPLAPFAAAALLAAGLPRLAQADIYSWLDAEGRAHFTQDLTQVPAQQRADAERGARHEAQSSTALPAEALARVSAPMRVRPGAAVEVPFEKQGTAMLVQVCINDRVTAPFIIDTGASDVVVPWQVAHDAGVQISSDTPRQSYQTANGMIESPIVTLASVEIGGARVENLRGSLSDSMSVGLLGGTFFSNFTFQIDPAAGVITLRPNAQVRAGANQAEWRERFRALRSEIAEIDAHTSGAPLLDEARAQHLQQKRAALEAELETLEREANDTGVPPGWRD